MAANGRCSDARVAMAFNKKGTSDEKFKCRVEVQFSAWKVHS